MRNRAKCRLCQSIIESFHKEDYVACKCGEISISGGVYQYDCGAKDFQNFLRIDDDGNEIVVKVEQNAKPKNDKPSKKDLLDSLDHMIESIERLPDNAKAHPINHYDLASALILLSCILRSD